MEIDTENRNRGEIDHLLFGSGRWCQLRQKCCLCGKNGLEFRQKSCSGQGKRKQHSKTMECETGVFRKLHSPVLLK